MDLSTDDASPPLAERFRAFLQTPSFPRVGAEPAPTRGPIRSVVGRDRARPAPFQGLPAIPGQPGTPSEEGFAAAHERGRRAAEPSR
ncbi:hypothetical protein MKK70_10420 [Methylobacterium sp. E-041]|uniref:hypothetical protein n=1 Tax=Methylobacterium sp. E-041 TaxID=2836573 RepID=UPI001FBBFD9D|nr:hypothetical protein [Methylobacterium sp. E-041]MCJ2105778.1 hypothetical protein [Methylobacterium sp. E-041]